MYYIRICIFGIWILQPINNDTHLLDDFMAINNSSDIFAAKPDNQLMKLWKLDTMTNYDHIAKIFF